jgi:hypothetical protein
MWIVCAIMDRAEPATGNGQRATGNGRKKPEARIV